MKKYDLAIWAHHGMFCSGEDFDLTFGLMHTIEKAAEIYMKVVSSGRPVLQTIRDADLQAIADECGDDLYAVDQDSMEQVVVELLKELGMTACTCESMTGGLIAGRITSIPGASDVFECGLVTYSNRIKHKLADVSVKTLDEHTAVSLETAAEMAKGALLLGRLCRALDHGRRRPRRHARRRGRHRLCRPVRAAGHARKQGRHAALERPRLQQKPCHGQGARRAAAVSA